MTLNFQSDEIKKLIELGFLLHEKDLKCYTFDQYRDNGTQHVPLVYDYFFNSKKLPKGMISGEIYEGGFLQHDLVLDIVMGEHIEKGFRYKNAIRFYIFDIFQECNHYKNYVSLLKPDLKSCPQPNFPIIRSYKINDNSYPSDGCYDIPELKVADPNFTNEEVSETWYDLNDEKKMQLFLDAFETLGFKREDVKCVLEGTKTAYQALEAIAPIERSFFWNKLKFTFTGNILTSITWKSSNIEHFLEENLDCITFPFDGPIIIDCSKIAYFPINFGENKNGHKLINIHNNRCKLQKAYLKNAVIEKPIDLSKIDAADTVFGHHVVINLENSIAPIDTIDLTFAVNEDGKRYELDEHGHVQFDEFNKPKTLPFSSEVSQVSQSLSRVRKKCEN